MEQVKIICTQHIHFGINVDEVTDKVIADYAKSPFETEESHFVDFHQSGKCPVETYRLSEVVDLAQVHLGRRRRRSATSFATPRANIRPECLTETSRVFVVYSYDPAQKGIRIQSAMPIREDANINDELGDYYAEFGPRVVPNFSEYKLPQIRKWYEKRGFCLALSDKDWAGFKAQD
jgi:hypothetical protein